MFPMFNRIFDALDELGHLKAFKALDDQLLIALDAAPNWRCAMATTH